MYVLYRSRHVLGWMPAALAAVLIAWTLQRVPLKIQPTYDESSVQLALAEPEPAMAEPTAEPVLPEPPPPPPPTEVEPESEIPQVVAEEPVAPPPPKPRIEPKPQPKPKPRVEQRPKAAPRPRQAAPTAAPVAARVAEVAPQPATAPSPAAPAPAAAPQRPSVNSAALEGGYLQGVRSDLERFKQYPTGRQAALERPSGKVVIWLLVDRSGKVLDRGVEERASSMLLNRAATTSLARIEHVKPFPQEAFAGRSQMRITATFDYSPH